MSRPVHIVCSYCDQVNRLPEQRLGDRPVCGSCGQKLFKGKPVELGSGNFAVHVGKSDLPVLVDFWAPWCGPCRMMAPVFEQVASDLDTRVRLAKVNTEAEHSLATRYNIRSIPTLAMFKKGKEVARMAGAMDRQGLIRWIEQNS